MASRLCQLTILLLLLPRGLARLLPVLGLLSIEDGGIVGGDVGEGRGSSIGSGGGEGAEEGGGGGGGGGSDKQPSREHYGY